MYIYENIFLNLTDGLIQLHPPLFYISLVFVSTILFKKFLGTYKITKMLIYYKITFLLLFTSLLSGGYWSYTQLLWGNWWTWDNIELFLFFIILLFINFLHQQNNKTNTNFIFIFNNILIVFFIFAFLRTGYIQSKHNFFNAVSIDTININYFVVSLLFVFFLITPLMIFKTIYILMKKKINVFILLFIYFIFFNLLLFYLKLYSNYNYFTTFYLIFIFVFLLVLINLIKTRTTTIKIHLLLSFIFIFTFFIKTNLFVLNLNNMYIYNLKHYAFSASVYKLNFQTYDNFFIKFLKNKVYFEYNVIYPKVTKFYSNLFFLSYNTNTCNNYCSHKIDYIVNQHTAMNYYLISNYYPFKQLTSYNLCVLYYNIINFYFVSLTVVFGLLILTFTY